MICAHRLIMLYICTKFCQSISKGFRVTDPDSRVDARVVTKVDGRTDKHTYRQKSGSLYRAMLESGMTMNTLAELWPLTIFKRTGCL